MDLQKILNTPIKELVLQNPRLSALYALVHNFKPDTCLEIGTEYGLGAAAICLALKNNQKGKLITIESNEKEIQISKEFLEKNELSEWVEFVKGHSPGDLPLRKYDFVFFDQTEKTLFSEELGILYPHLAQDCLCMAHDTNETHGGNLLKSFLGVKNIGSVDLEPYNFVKFVGTTIFRIKKEE